MHSESLTLSSAQASLSSITLDLWSKVKGLPLTSALQMGKRNSRTFYIAHSGMQVVKSYVGSEVDLEDQSKRAVQLR